MNDFNHHPFLVIWESTRACDLACVHCRAEATPEPLHHELNTAEAMKLLDDVAAMGTPLFIFTGGDPLKRPDLNDLILHAKTLGMRVGAIPAVTPLLTRDRLHELKEYGLDQVAFSMDSADPVEHDQFRRIPGVFERTVNAIHMAREVGLRVQINSLVNVHNQYSLDNLIAYVEKLPIVFWEVFFLVPTGRGRLLPILTPQKFEEAFRKIHALGRRVRFVIKVTEGQHYRRFVYESGAANAAEELHRSVGHEGGVGLAPQGVNAGKGFMFISCEGDLMPSGFLPIPAGNVRRDDVAQVYRESELFKNLRNTALLKGRCGQCKFKDMCGGSRARAFAMTGDMFAEDPACFYETA